MSASGLRIRLVTPAAPAGARTGNRVTARRWARMLRELGHRARVCEGEPGDGAFDLLVALHAQKTRGALEAARRERPEAARIVVLTGTELYGDLARDRAARAALDDCARIIVLQELALDALDALEPAWRAKARVIVQSAVGLARPPAPRVRSFDALLLAHLRAVKDPLLAARAARALAPESRLRVLHFGAALEPGFERAARDEARANPRYVWAGPIPAGRARRELARARLLVVPSRVEGGSSALSEALAQGTPILATDIPGNVGLLGADHPGLFAPGDEAALTRLFERAESRPGWLDEVARAGSARAFLVEPARERAAWHALLAEMR